jgi:hypothetical protein
MPNDAEDIEQFLAEEYDGPSGCPIGPPGPQGPTGLPVLFSGFVDPAAPGGDAMGWYANGQIGHSNPDVSIDADHSSSTTIITQPNNHALHPVGESYNLDFSTLASSYSANVAHMGSASSPNSNGDIYPPLTAQDLSDAMAQLASVANDPNLVVQTGFSIAFPPTNSSFQVMAEATAPSYDPEKDDIMAAKQKSVARYTELSFAISELTKHFYHAIPWMYILYLYKVKDRHFFFQYLESLPAMHFAIEDERSLSLMAKWSGDNGGNFFKKQEKVKPKRKSDVHVALSDDDNTLPKDIQEALNLSIKKHRYSDYHKYTASSKILIRDLRHIDLYNWGFTLQTGTPIDIVAIKKKCLRENNAFFSTSQDEGTMDSVWGMGGVSEHQNYADNLDQMIGTSIDLPTDEQKGSSIIGYWDYADEYNMSDEEMDELLLNPGKKGKADFDVGQNKHRNIIL